MNAAPDLEYRNQGNVPSDPVEHKYDCLTHCVPQQLRVDLYFLKLFVTTISEL